jgi:hypothetical protein
VQQLETSRSSLALAPEVVARLPRVDEAATAGLCSSRAMAACVSVAWAACGASARRALARLVGSSAAIGGG